MGLQASAALAALVEPLRADSRIAVLEDAERTLKSVLQRELAAPLDGAGIRELASLQQRLGFLLKYKSYAVKAASPLGYSVFLQQPGEGFSFQQHVVHKTEMFYFLDVPAGGFVFLCDFPEWQRIYDREAFLAWMGGKPDARYERWRFVPQPGDVIVIDKLNMVHSVIGEAGRSRSVIPSQRVAGGIRTVLDDGIVTAATYRFDPGAVSETSVDSTRATSLHVVHGSGRLVLGDAAEVQRSSPPTLAARAGDLFFVAPGACWGFINDGHVPLTVAEHRIPADIAFV